MLILQTALAVILATRETAVKAQIARPGVTAFGHPELARVIKRDLEAIAGPGTVDVSVENGRHIVVRIAVRSLSAEICNPIYARERELYRLFPDLDFDFYFGGPELARAIKTNLETISGPGTVDVSIDNETLFSVRIMVPSLGSEIRSPIYDRELELYRLFPGLNFDFYLRPKSLFTDR